MAKQVSEIANIYTSPVLELINRAYTIHRDNFSDDIELCQLISVKTGGCPEDCGYCSQSNKYETELTPNPLLSVEEIKRQVEIAKLNGVRRVCLGAGYKTPNSRALDTVTEYVKIIKDAGLEACATLGSLSSEQADKLKKAGLDYYNHNIDTSPEYYSNVVSTRTFSDRVDTISNVGNAGLKICCGGIIGMGESRKDRISFIEALTKLPYQPSSIPINCLVPIKGTPLAEKANLDKLELIRTIATVRILFPKTRIRLSAGRSQLSDLEQSTCFMAGANSIFYGEKLLTTPNNPQNADKMLISKLGLSTHATVME